jgi:hypothetical protein
MYEETFRVLEDSFGDQNLAAAYHTKLKTRIQLVDKSLEDFATAVRQLAHHAYCALHDDHIRRKAGRAFADVGDLDVKIQLLLVGKKMVMKALRQAFELQTVFLVARPQETRAGTFWGSWSPLLSKGTTNDLHAGAVGGMATCMEIAPIKLQRQQSTPEMRQ